ncbi:hypothetical protein L596_027044 [Steinernema carpocapsae]|uniref:Uncharacterized protein n=1 Tax=Steinernema carpocapsae TaxID=34508 RepID=A0A4U5M3A7_STECR|nr:hypothetical protein L596_027044 [Steinernema carpocapsae]
MDPSDLPSTSAASAPADAMADDAISVSSRAMDEQNLPCSSYKALQKAHELAARYANSDDPQLVDFLIESQAFIKRSALLKAPYLSDRHIEERRARSLAHLPLEIINDIVNQSQLASDDFANILKIPGPFRSFARTRKEVISVNQTGAFPSSTMQSERRPFQISSLQQLQGIRIHFFQFLQGGHENLFQNPNFNTILQTHRLTLYGWYDHMYIEIPNRSQRRPIEYLNRVFENSPNFIPARCITVNLSDNERNSPDLEQTYRMCPNFKEFLKRAVTLERKERLKFNYNGNDSKFYRGNDSKDLSDAVASGFAQERLDRVYYMGTFNQAQVKTLLDRSDDFIPKYDIAEFKTKVSFEEKFPDFLKTEFELTEEKTSTYIYESKLLKSHYYIHIYRHKHLLTVTVVKTPVVESLSDNAIQEAERSDEKKDEPTTSKRKKPSILTQLAKRFK